MHWASYKNNAKSVKLLLLAGANINAVDLNHDTPISWAARKGKISYLLTIMMLFGSIKKKKRENK